MLAVRHGIENQFHPARNPHFVEDAQQILFDGVFAEPQFGGDSAVGQAVGHEGDDLLLARGEQRSAGGTDEAERGHFRQGIEHGIHLPVVDPDFSPGNALDAFAEHGKGSLGKEENTFCAGAQGVHYQFAVVAFRQQNGSGLGMRNTQPAQQA